MYFMAEAPRVKSVFHFSKKKKGTLLILPMFKKFRINALFKFLFNLSI